MKETSSFIIHQHKTKRPHLDLTLKKDGEPRSWILPLGVPEKVNERRIAIEEPGVHEEESQAKRSDFYGEGRSAPWDSGAFHISTENKIKYIFSADGKKLKGKFLLHNPGWGRWTKRKLWVLEKVPEK